MEVKNKKDEDKSVHGLSHDTPKSSLTEVFDHNRPKPPLPPPPLQKEEQQRDNCQGIGIGWYF